MRDYGRHVEVPAEVSELTRRHLAHVDRAKPGLLTGLYLTGSVALGDFRPKWSDIDFVGVLDREPTQDDLEALVGVHAGLTSRRPYDGVYLSGPTALHGLAVGRPPGTYARTHDGVFSVDQWGTELEPAPWLELGRYGIPVRGPLPTALGRPDPDSLRSWLLGNLAGYWADLVDQVEGAVRDRPPDAPTFGETVSWVVLGPPRLHFTLATGEVTTKSCAAAYIADRFTPWADLAERCRRRRHGEAISFVIGDMVDAIRLARQVRTDAERRWAEKSE